MTEFKFKLGEKVKDRLTGFAGIVTANVEWLTGCNTVYVKPQDLKDGEPFEAVQFDEPMLDRVGVGLSGKIERPVDPKQRGGPRPTIRRTR